MPATVLSLEYGNTDRPPLITTLLLSLQHAFLSVSSLLLPVVLLSTFANPYDAAHIIQATILASGIGTILLSLHTRLFNANVFLCSYYDPVNYSLSYLALQSGGPPLLYAVNYLQSGLLILFAEGITKLRKFVPLEIAGLVIFMTALSVISAAICNSFGGVDKLVDLRFDVGACLVSSLSLLVMIGLSVWGGKHFAKCSLLAGVIFGLILDALVNPRTTPLILSSTIVSAPTVIWPSFNLLRWDYVLPLCVATLGVGLKSMGNLIAMQKINTPAWERTDVPQVKRGLLTNAISSFISSLFGGFTLGMSTGNVGFVAATGVSSRILGSVVGSALVVASFFPVVSELVAQIPKPVIGAVLVFVIPSILIAGIQVMTSRPTNARRVFLIGLPIVIGLAFEFVPQLERDIPPTYRLITESPLTTATILAMILNCVFIIGNRRKAQMPVDLSALADGACVVSVKDHTAAWNLAEGTVATAQDTLTTLLSSLKLIAANGQAVVAMDYDDYQFNVEIRYVGKACDTQLSKLNLGDMAKKVDQIKCSTLADGGQQFIRFVFEQ